MDRSLTWWMKEGFCPEEGFGAPNGIKKVRKGQGISSNYYYRVRNSYCSFLKKHLQEKNVRAVKDHKNHFTWCFHLTGENLSLAWPDCHPLFHWRPSVKDKPSLSSKAKTKPLSPKSYTAQPILLDNNKHNGSICWASARCGTLC